MNMHVVRRVLCLALGVSCLALGAATIIEKDLPFNTYPFSDPDLMPGTGEKRYPYICFNGYTDQGVTQAWHVVELENEDIVVSVMPGLGGKVLGAVDKKTGREFIYYNHTVKFRPVAIRGPWTSGGIEFNFVRGHNTYSAFPVDYVTRQNEDGSVSCFVGTPERITREWWQVEVHVPAHGDSFETRSIRFNAGNMPMPFMHWSTTAYSARHDPEFVFPGDTWLGHEGDAHPWPIDEKGHDLRFYCNNTFGHDKAYHVIGANDIFGIWWKDLGLGSVHVSPPYEKYGRKIFLWSNAREGDIWEKLLTDTDGQYAELQAGRPLQQAAGTFWRTPFGYRSLAPGQTEQFSERWAVVRNREDFAKYQSETSVVHRPTERPKDYDGATAAALVRRAEQSVLTICPYAEIKGYYDAALGKDPNFVPALTGLATQELKSGHYAEARRLCTRALAIDTYDPEANFRDGQCAFEMGDNTLARDRFGLAAFDAGYQGAALAFVARTYLREGRWERAIAAADRARAVNDLELDAHLARLVAMRKLGRTSLAAAAARELLARVPLFHAARYELALCGGEQDWRRYIRNESPAETLMEMATWYESSGLFENAMHLFAAAMPDTLACLRLAKLKTSDAARLMAQAKTRPVAGVCPFRREELPALECAVRTDGDWRFRYLLAVLHAALGDHALAVQELETCGDRPDEAVFYRYRATFRSAANRMKDLDRAVALGDEWRTGHAKFELLAETGDWKAARLCAREYLVKYPGNDRLEVDMAIALCKLALWDESAAFLKTVKIIPAEGASDLAHAFADTHRQLAARALARGDCASAEREVALALSFPEQLGTGRPYELDEYIENWPKELREMIEKGER